MNFNKIGEEIAIIKEGNKKKSLYVTDEENNKDKFYNYLDLEDDSKFEIVPDKNADRDTLYIVGMQGSGKSYWIREYLKNYHALFKNNKVYLFSSKKEDVNLDDLEYIKRVKIDSSFVEQPLEYEELKNSMVIFDDIDALTGPIKKAIYELRDAILKNGRSYKIDIISTSHAPCGRENQTPLNESRKIVFFLKNYNKSMRYFLENYIGLEKHQIKILRDNKTRATTFIKSYPNVIIQEKNAYIMKDI